MAYGLGIDVGTTYTAAALLREGNVETFSLGTYQVAVPSVVFAAGGEFLFGTPAERRGATEPDGLGREFKRRLGDPVPVMLSGSPYHADRLTALMGKWVVDTVTEQVGEPPKRIVMTHPANWTEYQLGVLANALRDVGLARVEMLSEPAAAALDYAAAAAVEEGALVLVYDLGGGTFDVALLRRRGGGFEHEIDPFGIERLGGIDFDEAVFHFVIGEVPAEIVASARQSREGSAALANLRRSCVEAKESLSSDAATDIPVMLPGHTSNVRITRSEFEDMIRPMIQQTIEGVSVTVARAEVEPAALAAILLVGGSSRIPLVPQMVSDQLGVPVRIDAHPKLVVAKGAARQAGAPTARAARVSSPRPVVWDPDDDDDDGPDRRWWVAAAALAVAVAGVGGWLLTRGDDPAESGNATTTASAPSNASLEPTTPTPAPTTADPTTTTPTSAPAELVAFAVVDECPTEPKPHDIAVVGTDLWVTPARSDVLQRCGTTESSPQPDTVVLGSGVEEGSETGHQIVPIPGFLYITRRHAETVARVDLTDMSIDSIEVDGSPFGAELVGDTVWVTSDTDDAAFPGRLTPIDGATAGSAISLPCFPGHVRQIGGELWVACIFNNTILRVDPNVRTVTEVDLPGAPFDMLPVGDEVWVTLWQGNQVVVLDPTAGGVTDLINVGSGPYMVIEAFGSVWVSNGGATPGSISRIDPDTRLEVQPPIEVGVGPVALAADDDRLYVGNYGGESVSVLAPEG